MVTGVRFVEPKTDKWTVMFAAPAFGVAIRMEGGAEGDRIVLRGHDDKGASLRWSFNDIRADSFVWRGETSHDGGKTWRLEEEHHMTRRGRASASTRYACGVTVKLVRGTHKPSRDELHLPLTWVIRRVDVGQAPGANRVHLNNGLPFRPAIVVLALGHDREAAGPQRLACVLVERVAHPHVEGALQDHHVFVRGMEVRRDPVAVRHFEAERHK